ncbi:SCO-spondin-like [Scleropages formosus]|uniref:SCO-spondin-like n=1 Tax=Scleropages formosus TaxID=113540 RepID=A0A0P7UPK2_SCLFO|nr:SCO-spondin-like [Scleropages formosus]
MSEAWCSVQVNSSSGDVCPVGHFCPSGTRHPQENPCPPGTWSNAVGARDSSSCWLCPAGFFCNGSALIQPSGLCAPGFYCSGGAKSARPVDGITGNRCPVGYHCPQGSTSPVNCQDGSYSNTTGMLGEQLSLPQLILVLYVHCAAECLDCPSGMYCPSGVGVQSCPAGHYCPGGTGTEEVLPCPPGTFSPEPGRSQLEQCQLCPAGMYCEDWGQTEPTGPCQAGYFCLAGINFPNPDGNISTGVGGPCPQGHYCPAGTSLPVPCPLGRFSERKDGNINQTGAGTDESSGNNMVTVRSLLPCTCAGHRAGEEPEMGAEPGPSPGVCPLAHYCPFGSAAPLPCPAGSYTNLSSQAHCPRCPAGYYCPERTSNYSQFPCPAGFYCPDGTRHATQFPCPRGYYNPEPMTQSLDSCLPCPPGHYCEKERLTAVSGKCKAGWFCVSAAWNSQPFDLDNYTNANCLCPATSTGGKCQEGFYCPSGSSEPFPCPPGAFCNASEEGSREPELCPPGTFSSAVGLPSKFHCRMCTPGFYCGTEGLLAPTGACDAGYWCPLGQTTRTAIPCPVGHHCPVGSAAPVPCPVGSYQDKENQAACKPCEAGYYCDGGFGLTNASSLRPCPKGHYCPPGTHLPDQYKCPPGTFNSKERMDSIDGCISCPPGKFCFAMGLSEPTGDCHAGFWCQKAAHTPSPVAGPSGGPCPAGHYCPKGTLIPVPCPVGTWSNTTGHKSPEECQECPGGFYCGTHGLTVPTGPCSGGFYCLGKAESATPTDNITGGPCPKEHYCPAGTAQPLQCEPGTFMDATQATQCWSCPAGMYCLAGTAHVCPAGFYCPENSGYDSKPCPEGTYSPDPGLTMASQCKECDGGHFCSLRNATAPSGLCSAGYYCTRGNTSPQPHPQDPGEGGACPAGHYCPRGTTDSQPCPEGTFSNLTKMGSQGDCLLCSPGHFCDIPGLSSPRGECWEGFFCQLGAVLPNAPTRDSRGGPCVPGTIVLGIALSMRVKNVHLGTTVHQAPEPSLRHFCASGGLKAPSGPCAAGHFCRGGATSPTSGDGCPAGHYCPEGSASPKPCPPGRYSNTSGNVELSDCLPCPAEGIMPALFFLSQDSPVRPLGFHLPLSPAKLAIIAPWDKEMAKCLHIPARWDTCVLQAVLLRSPVHLGPIRTSLSRQAGRRGWGNTSCLSECKSVPNYKDGLGSHTPITCPKGHYCPEGSSSGVAFPCPLGFLSTRVGLPSVDGCEPCPPGKYCSSVGLSAPTGDCSPGYLCTQGAVFPQPVGGATGGLCSPGFYCPKGTSHMLPCPSGTFNPLEGAASADACVPCLPGKYCAGSGLDSPSGLCWPGHYCVLGANSPAPNTTGISTHLSSYTADEFLLDQSRGDICPKGYYCPSGSSHPRPCPPGAFLGKYGAKSEVECDPCTPGFYCPEWGQGSADLKCPEGWYCPAGSGSSQQLDYQCDPGHACPSGSILPSPCPSGSYQPLPAQPTCSTCPPGHYCSLGATDPTPVSQSFGDLCPPGHFCPHGSSAPVPCPAGTYLSDSGAPSWTHCLPCPPGFYCSSSGSTLPSGLCSPGYYCAGGASSATPLARTSHTGYLQDVTLSSRGTEHALRAWVHNETVLGFYCPRGSAQPQPCDRGLYCDRVGLFTPAGSCAAGYFCPRGSTDPQASLCPAGHYCPLGTSNPIPCPLGTLRSSPGGSAEDDCLACPPGHFCAQMGLLSHSGLCASGYHCPGGQLSARPQEHICRAGHHCGEGSPVERSCSPGSYQASEGQEACDVCPSGYFCPEEAMKQPIPCQKGFYCPIGTTSQRPCPPGTYGNHSGMTKATDCTLCDPGMYCKGSAPSDGAMGDLCPSGFYCPVGSLAPSPCPRGFFSDQVGLSAPTQCWICPPGFYCSEPGLRSVSGPCLPGFFCLEGSESATPMAGVCIAGHYCEGGSAIPKPCPPGTHRLEEGGKSREDCIPCHQDWFQDLEGQVKCKPCPPRYYCPVSVKDFEGVTTPLPCPAGHFCQTGLSPCPKGTYSSVHGLSSADECLLCPEGYFCGSAGLVQPSGTCSPGFLCLAGAQQPKPTDNHTGSPCPRGAYCLLGVIAGMFCAHHGCAIPTGLCQAGYLCHSGASSPNATGHTVQSPGTDLCPPGHYCPAGTAYPMPCPPGSYSSSPGLKEVEQCQPCPPGHFCDHPALVDISEAALCDAG